MSTTYKIVVAVLFGLGFLLTALKTWAVFRWHGYKAGAIYAVGALVQLGMFVWTLAQ